MFFINIIVPGVQHGWAGRHAVGVACDGSRLRKPARGGVCLREPPLAVRAVPLVVAEPLGGPGGAVAVVGRLLTLVAAGHIERSLPPLGGWGACRVGGGRGGSGGWLAARSPGISRAES